MPSPHPRVRAGSALLAEAAVFLTTDLAIIAGVIALLAALMIRTSSWRRLLALAKIFVILGVTLCVLWAVVLRSAPGQPIGSDPIAGLQFAILVALRLMCASLIAHVTILGIPSKDIPKALAACGAHGALLAAVIGAFALVPEAELRTRQVLTARYARGLSRGRTFWGLATHLPVTLRPVLAWTLRSALHRSEMWSQRGLLERLEKTGSPLTGSLLGNVLWLSPALLWFSSSAVFALLHYTRH